MKKILFIACVALLLPLSTHAALIKGGDEYSLRQLDVVTGDLYVGAGTASIAGVVRGDLSVGGGTVLYSGYTAGDILVGGGTVTLTGRANDDVRVVGGTVIVSGPIAGDLIVAGGQVRVESTASIAGDVLVGGGRVVFDGPVQGNVRVYGGQVDIESIVNGSVEAAADKLVIGPRARIRGDLIYRAPQRAVIANSAVIDGKTIYKETKDFAAMGKTSVREAVTAFLGLWLILKFIMTLLIALIIALLFGNLAHELVYRVVHEPWWTVLMGFVLLVSLPVATLLICMTIVGIPIGILALLMYAFFILLSIPLASLICGVWAIKLIKKESTIAVTWQAAVLGALIYTVLGFIPILGWVVKLLFVLAALGAFSHYWYRFIWMNR